MKSFLMRRASIIAVPLLSATWSALAIAQGAPPPPPPGPPAAQPPPAPTPPPPPATPAVTTATPAAKWYDKAKIEGFVDAYANVNFNFPTPAVGGNLGRAFDTTNGFAMHWAGLNASYAPDPVGGTVSLRFGPSAYIYNGSPATPGTDSSNGLAFVKQAFASWKPGGGMVTLDIGKFDTWIGAEVADSQYNMTYTRSALFFTQPLFHTGLRLDIAASEQVDIKLFLVNGVNNSVDNNGGKSFGASVGLTPTKTMAFYLNYMGGPEQPNIAGMPPAFDSDASSRLRHVVDVVADMKFDAARVLINADYGTEKLTTTPTSTKYSYFGGNVTLGYAVNDQFAIAVRGGYLSDPDGFFAPGFGAPGGVKTSVIDGTLTLAATPTPNLIIKLEPRIDSVSSPDTAGWPGGFPKAADADPPGVSKTLFTTTLGVVVTTN